MIAAEFHWKNEVWTVAVAMLVLAAAAVAHPLGDRAFDRGVQVVVEPTRLVVQYELALDPVTLAFEMRRFFEPTEMPAGVEESADLFGRTLLPIVARGVLVIFDGRELELHPVRFVRFQDDHLRWRFVLQGALPAWTGRARIEVRDRNFEEERGYRRIALRGAAGVSFDQCTAAAALSDVPLTPTWQMTPEEEEASSQASAWMTPASPSSAEPVLFTVWTTAASMAAGFMGGVFHAWAAGKACGAGRRRSNESKTVAGDASMAIGHSASALFLSLLAPLLVQSDGMQHPTGSSVLSLICGVLLALLGADRWRREACGELSGAFRATGGLIRCDEAAAILLAAVGCGRAFLAFPLLVGFTAGMWAAPACGKLSHSEGKATAHAAARSGRRRAVAARLLGAVIFATGVSMAAVGISGLR